MLRRKKQEELQTRQYPGKALFQMRTGSGRVLTEFSISWTTTKLLPAMWTWSMPKRPKSWKLHQTLLSSLKHLLGKK